MTRFPNTRFFLFHLSIPFQERESVKSMPPLSRQARPLLRSIKGKKHASPEDHDEDGGAATGRTTKNMTEEDLLADPVSSSDEAEPPPAMLSHSPPSNISAHEISRPNARMTNGTARPKKLNKPIVPQRGAFDKGKAHKAGKDWQHDKENKEDDQGFTFGMEYERPKKRQKTADGAVSRNVHAAPATFGKKAKAYGKGAKQPSYLSRIPKEEDLDHIEYLDATLDDKKSTPQSASSPAKPAYPSLFERMGLAIPSSDPTNTATQTTNPSSPLSALPDSFEEEATELPAYQDEDSVCALCEETVDVDEQEEFWRTHHDRTVRNQMLFCAQHKQRKAETTYRDAGYPKINFAALPRRIRKFHPELVKLLKNETEEESEYRKQHAEKLVSGKASALPSRRQTKKAKLEQDVLETVSANASSTGYYGPRGKRIMMEAITADLSDVIREVAANDPVVGRSGFAVFLQAVLVPELTVMLVMEDMQVGKKRAYEIVQESTEMGTLLHEEIDDQVELDSDEEDEQEEGQED